MNKNKLALVLLSVVIGFSLIGCSSGSGSNSAPSSCTISKTSQSMGVSMTVRLSGSSAQEHCKTATENAKTDTEGFTIEQNAPNTTPTCTVKHNGLTFDVWSDSDLFATMACNSFKSDN